MQDEEHCVRIQIRKAASAVIQDHFMCEIPSTKAKVKFAQRNLLRFTLWQT